ncbi:MAG: hypothetical protein HYV60_10720, partial [Planctomycetia bacterium]|nr:hypothetical protein [Planctomycetia bacterium]
MWQRLLHLSLIYGGSDESREELHFDHATAIELLTEPEDNSISAAPNPSEVSALQAAIDWLESYGWARRTSDWTAADWRLLGLVQDGLSSEGGLIERTPIFIANDQAGKVLWLVAERLPGPPRLITPHCWRLGLAPLGDRKQLLESIHVGFRAALGDAAETRHQIRWWLETSTP